MCTEKYSGFPRSSLGSSTTASSGSGVPSRAQGVAATSRVPPLAPSSATMRRCVVSVSMLYARGCVRSSATPSLRISLDAAIFADARIASAASDVNSSPSRHCA